ncbi:hypothetical protein HUW46_09119 [Amycolatopsis sp. CA-230715]|nr:hypothetical protein HUW46_09119 [Amycolatopsis sp. CA-230715]
MRTAGLAMTDVWAHRIQLEPGADTHRHDRLAAEIGVYVESAELLHRGHAENYRPYLHVTGELRWLAPAQTLPYGISRVTFSPGQGDTVDAFYQFDDQQLAQLVAKGYFRGDFAVPEETITGIEWELPATMDALILGPAGAPGADVPIVFTRVHDIAALEIDLATSGYDLVDYFPDRSRGSVPQAGITPDEPGPRGHPDEIDPLFPDQDLTTETRDPNADTDADSVRARVRQVEADLAAERERIRAERQRTDGTPENLYYHHVAQPLTRTGPLAPLPEPEPAPDSDLDFGAPRGVPDTSASTATERPRAGADHTAVLDVGDSSERELES